MSTNQLFMTGAIDQMNEAGRFFCEHSEAEDLRLVLDLDDHALLDAINSSSNDFSRRLLDFVAKFEQGVYPDDLTGMICERVADVLEREDEIIEEPPHLADIDPAFASHDESAAVPYHGNIG